MLYYYVHTMSSTPSDLPINNPVIMGIDPGLADLGWGVVTNEKSLIKLVDFGVIKTKSTQKLTDRLQSIYREITKIIKNYQPNRIGIEQLFFGKNAKTAMVVGEARGVVLLALAQLGYEPIEFKPAEIKMTLTGYGNADKKQIQFMVKTMLKLKHIPKPDDAADALAVAITCAITNPRLKGVRS